MSESDQRQKLDAERKFVGKLPDRYAKDWFAHLDEHSDIGTIFQQWMHREAR